MSILPLLFPDSERPHYISGQTELEFHFSSIMYILYILPHMYYFDVKGRLQLKYKFALKVDQICIDFDKIILHARAKPDLLGTNP